MDTTSPRDGTPATVAEELLVRLADVDPAEAPAIADDLARVLADAQDDAGAPHQLEAEFATEMRS